MRETFKRRRTLLKSVAALPNSLCGMIGGSFKNSTLHFLPVLLFLLKAQFKKGLHAETKIPDEWKKSTGKEIEQRVLNGSDTII